MVGEKRVFHPGANLMIWRYERVCYKCSVKSFLDGCGAHMTITPSRDNDRRGDVNRGVRLEEVVEKRGKRVYGSGGAPNFACTGGKIQITC
jgi:hypothetical protein